MELLTSTQLNIPVLQVVLLLALTTGALLMGRLKLALLINYCFTLYWGFIAHIDIFSTDGAIKLNGFAFLYFGFGLVIILLAILGLITHRE